MLTAGPQAFDDMQRAAALLLALAVKSGGALLARRSGCISFSPLIRQFVPSFESFDLHLHCVCIHEGFARTPARSHQHLYVSSTVSCKHHMLHSPAPHCIPVHHIQRQVIMYIASGRTFYSHVCSPSERDWRKCPAAADMSLASRLCRSSLASRSRPCFQSTLPTAFHVPWPYSAEAGALAHVCKGFFHWRGWCTN